MRIFVLLTLIMTFSLPVFSASNSSEFKPHLVALSVPDLKASIQWYEDHLGFIVLSTNEYPEYDLSIAMMERKGFNLELIQHGDSISQHSVLPDKSNPATLQGIIKLAFWIDNVKAKAREFKDLDMDFKMELRVNDEAETMSFIVTDIAGNWIQFIGSM